MRYPAIVNSTVRNVLLAMLLAAALPTQAEMYKWVDEKGRVYYTDTLPPQSSRHAVIELGKTGQAMWRTESVEERRAREEKERKVAEQKKIAEEQARKDRALLATYTSEAEIDLARDRALEHHRLAIKGAETRLDQLAARAKQMQGEIQTIKSRGHPIPPSLQNQMTAIQKEAEELKKVIRTNQEAMITVRAKYDADKARYRELTTKSSTGSCCYAGW